MLIFEASASDELTRKVLDKLRVYAPILEYLQFFQEPGAGTTKRYKDNIDGTFDNRAIGNPFTIQELGPKYGTFALKVIGKTIRLDTAFEEQGGDVPSEFEIELMNWAENAGRNLLSKLINDDSTATAGDPPVSLNQFDGLRTLIDNLVTGGDDSRVVSSGTNGLLVPGGTGATDRKAQDKFVELLDELIDSVDGGADCLMMDRRMLRRLSTVAKDQCEMKLNEFGAMIGDFNGTPIVPTSRNYDGSRIIPFTETVGNSTDCTSIYAFRSSEKANLTAMTTKSGFKVYPMQKVGNFLEVMPQLQMDMQPLADRCVARLEGIRID